MVDRWLRGTLGCLALSILLQLGAVLSPGWVVGQSSDGMTVYRGVFYVVVCNAGICESKTLSETWIGIQGGLRSSLIYGLVATLLELLISGCLTTLIAGLKVALMVQRRTWLEQYTTVSLFCLAITNSLQWVTVAGYINTNIVASWTADIMIFPWSVFMYGLSAMLVSTVILWQGILFLKGHSRSMLHGLHQPRREAATEQLKDIQ